MGYIFEPAKRASLAVDGIKDQFPVRRVYCVGRNYAKHAREMGADPTREPPFFFCKASDQQSVLSIPPDQVADLAYPSLTHDYHYEAELVVALGKGGKDIPIEQASQHIYGYAVGLDMTRRDLQAQMKAGGKSWEIAKAFDYSAPIGLLVPKSQVGEITQGKIQLSVDQQIKQDGLLQDMIWSIAETIANLSTYFTLEAGDIIFTGTPEGVGPVSRGQRLKAQIDQLPTLEVHIV